MIKRMVMWKFKEDTRETATEFLLALKDLKGKVPEILDLEVAFTAEEGSEFDAILVASFESFDAVNAYIVNPLHVAVASICAPICEKKSVFAYEETL